VTGWKGLFVNRGFTKKINELNQDESDDVLGFLFAHVASVSWRRGDERVVCLTLIENVCS